MFAGGLEGSLGVGTLDGVEDAFMLADCRGHAARLIGDVATIGGYAAA